MPAISDLGGTVVLAATLFVATNIDEILLLMLFLADRRYRRREVFAGQLAGNAALIGASIALSAVAVAIPQRWIGLLGLIPLALGLRALAEIFTLDDDVDIPAPPSKPGAVRRLTTVAAVTIANGGDNVGAYTPVFARIDFASMTVLVIVYMVMMAAWCGFGIYLVAHPRLAGPVRRVGRFLLPVVLIGLGIWILTGQPGG